VLAGRDSCDCPSIGIGLAFRRGVCFSLLASHGEARESATSKQEGG
jgi:hypothetical protein